MKQAYFFYQIWSKLVSVSQDAMMQYLISYTHTTSSTQSAKSALVVLLNKRANSMSHHMTLPAQYLVKFQKRFNHPPTFVRRPHAIYCVVILRVRMYMIITVRSLVLCGG